MHGRVAARRPARRAAHERAMRGVAEDDVAGGGLRLRVALDAEVHVALVKEFLREGTMRRVAGNAAFAQRLVPEDVRPGLLAVAVRARLVQAREREAALGLVDVEAVRVVALATVEPAFEDLVTMWQPEFRVRLEVAREARLRRLARIDNELVAALSTRLNVPAARPVAGLAAGLAGEARAVRVETPVRARGESAGVVRVAVGAGGVAGERRPFDGGRSGDGALDGGAGAEDQAATGSEEAERGRQPAEDAFAREAHRRSVP